MAITNSISFEVSAKELERVRRWSVRHKCPKRGKMGAIGGRTRFVFIPTEIGVIGGVECACGKKLELDCGGW